MNKFKLDTHEQKQVYWHINAKGKIYVKIHSASGLGHTWRSACKTDPPRRGNWTHLVSV